MGSSRRHPGLVAGLGYPCSRRLSASMPPATDPSGACVFTCAATRLLQLVLACYGIDERRVSLLGCCHVEMRGVAICCCSVDTTTRANEVDATSRLHAGTDWTTWSKSVMASPQKKKKGKKKKKKSVMATKALEIVFC